MNGTSGPGDAPLLGVSSCLLGNPVRYDGGHKLDRFLRDRLGAFVEFVPVCPEVECGLPVPREAMRLVDVLGEVLLLTQKTRRDITPAMAAWARGRIEDLRRLPLCGFVFKSKSPSSGMRGVKVYTEAGNPLSKAGAGIFARAFMEAFPYLPVEDEGRLQDDVIRENFIERVFVMHRWRGIETAGFTPGRLVDFHTRHKLILMSHSPSGLYELGRIVASAGGFPDRLREYRAGLMRILALKATPRKHANVLNHIAGYFKKFLDPREKAELASLIDDYRLGLVPLVVPITLLKHHLLMHGSPYLEGQCYLNPHPVELMLRNHV